MTPEDASYAALLAVDAIHAGKLEAYMGHYTVLVRKYYEGSIQKLADEALKLALKKA